MGCICLALLAVIIVGALGLDGGNFNVPDSVRSAGNDAQGKSSSSKNSTSQPSKRFLTEYMIDYAFNRWDKK